MPIESRHGGAAARRPEWTSQRAFVIASVASAVGLGNLWRFPYMAGENGGGTFIAAYAVCIIAVGLPLFILESSGGSLVDRGVVGLFRRIGGRRGGWFGWFIVFMCVMIMSYYMVITGWSLGYLVDSIRAAIRPFQAFTSGYASLWYFLAAGLLVFLVLRRGVRSIEWMSRILMPLLMLMVVALAIYTQTLEGGSQARDFYASFDLAAFMTPRLWQMAAGQAFYSLGVGLGVLIVYGSYVPKNVNIIASSVSVALTNSVVSLTAGIAVFSVIFTFDIPPDSGSELSFTAFPKIFEELAGGRYIAVVFFGLLFMAAFSSCYSSLAAVAAPLRDELRLSDSNASLIATLATLVLGIPSALSFTPLQLAIGGVPVLDRLDQIAGSGIVVGIGLIGVTLIAWRLPRGMLAAEMAAGEWRIGPVRLSPHAVVEYGRYMPAATVLLFLITLAV